MTDREPMKRLGISFPVDDGPPCMRCGGDLLDHLLCAGPDGGPDEYRCLRDLAQDVLHDMQTSEPADDGDRLDPAWVEVFEALATAHARSLISHEGPIVMDAVHYVVGRGWGKSQPPDDVVTREQHMADVLLAAMDAPTLDACGATATVFAVLRDIADHEPVTKHPAGDRPIHYCSSCSAGRFADLHEEGPFPHLISCPWRRVVEIVGVRPDQEVPTAPPVVCRCGHLESAHETQGWRACSYRDGCGCQLFTDREPTRG